MQMPELGPGWRDWKWGGRLCQGQASLYPHKPQLENGFSSLSPS